MADRLPLFPLGLVLVPGQLLPLHIFEERYRALVRDLLALPEQAQRFGVIAIRSGREVGADGVLALHEVGCTTVLRHTEPYPDGRFDVVTTGADRFRLLDLEHDRPYLTGLVELLPDDVGPAGEARVLTAAVQAALTDYVRALAAAGGAQAADLELDDDPRRLSHVVAASVRVDLEDRQALLEQPDAAHRLKAELVLLRREARLMRALSAVPAPELARAPLNPN
jgi:Lon protease-like protein